MIDWYPVQSVGASWQCTNCNAKITRCFVSGPCERYFQYPSCPQVPGQYCKTCTSIVTENHYKQEHSSIDLVD